MSFISRIVLDVEEQKTALSARLFDLAGEESFFINCNTIIKTAKEMSAKVDSARHDINAILDAPRSPFKVSAPATEEELDNAVDRVLQIERQTSEAWDTQREQMGRIVKSVRETPGIKRAMALRALNALNAAYRNAVTMLRDARTRLIVERLSQDELDEAVIETPGQLGAYFARAAGHE